MSKQLNEDTIINELKGSSLFFKEKTPAKPREEKDRVSRPITAVPDPQDHDTAPISSAPLGTAQNPSQPLTALKQESTGTHLSPPPTGGLSPSLAQGRPHYERPNENAHPTPTPETKPETPHREEGPDSASGRPTGDAPDRTPIRIRRTSTRYAFEFFQDQVETLKALSLDEQLRGEKGSMSQMVREAVDAYIAKRKRSED